MSCEVDIDQAIHLARQIAESGRVDDAEAQWLSDLGLDDDASSDDDGGNNESGG